MRFSEIQPCGCFSRDINEGMRAFCIVEMVKMENTLLSNVYLLRYAFNYKKCVPQNCKYAC